MSSSDLPTVAQPVIDAPAPKETGVKAETQTNGGPTDTTKASEVIAPVQEKKLTNAELKAKQKAEKAAKRAAAKSGSGQVTAPEVVPSSFEPSAVQNIDQEAISNTVPAPSTETVASETPSAQNGESPKAWQTQQKKAGASVAETRNFPVKGAPKPVVPIPLPVIPKKEDKTVEFFRHLYKPRTVTLAGVNKDVHPAILALGLQMSNYTICGSTARLVATMHAFKRVIEAYHTPPGNTLTRHLTSHVLSPQIEYLASCRPISISMGNAIRWLKLEISRVDIDIPDAEAKQYLCDAIDVFIRERITFSDAIIAKSTAERIKNGDVIMTYGKSSIVQKALILAHEDAKHFRVIVVDSRPLHEGRNMALSLVGLGLNVKYCLISGLSHNIQDVTKVLLGAHAMMSNGRLFARVGTALVAMEANESDKPVLVLCETIKFTERVALDSIVHNEMAPAEEMIILGGHLEKWESIKRLQLCNPMYDVTPADYITMIITESGNVPPTSVPVLHRLGNEGH